MEAVSVFVSVAVVSVLSPLVVSAIDDAGASVEVVGVSAAVVVAGAVSVSAVVLVAGADMTGSSFVSSGLDSVTVVDSLLLSALGVSPVSSEVAEVGAAAAGASSVFAGALDAPSGL